MNRYYRHTTSGALAEVLYRDNTCVQYRYVRGSGMVISEVRAFFNLHFTAVPDVEATAAQSIAPLPATEAGHVPRP